MPIQLPTTLPYPIPDDILDLKVTIDRSKCPGRLPNRVLDLEKNGLSLPFTELMTHSTIFYDNKQVRPRPSETLENARLRKVWQDVEDWDPRVVANATGQRRLIVNAPLNGEDSPALSKLLAEAVTLSVVVRVTQIPFRSWTPRYYQKISDMTLRQLWQVRKLSRRRRGASTPAVSPKR